MPDSARRKKATRATNFFSRKASPDFRWHSILPTQMGMDSDHPLAAGEVGRVGVAIDSLADMQALFEGIPLDRSQHVDDDQLDGRDSAVPVCAGRRSQGADRKKLSGTVQNDILKEYIARGTYIYPPRPAMRIITDLFAWADASCRSGTRFRSAAITSAKRARPRFRKWRSRWRMRLLISRRRLQPGLDVDAFAPRLSFFFNAHNNFLEEIAKYRAARRLYACLMRERFGAKSDRSLHAALSCADWRLDA